MNRLRRQRTFLQDILARNEQIQRFTRDGRDAFMADDRTQEAVIRCFEVIGEAVKRLDPELTARYPELPWRDYTGFRDVLIHQYDVILLHKVWDAAQSDLEPLHAAVHILLDSLSSSE